MQDKITYQFAAFNVCTIDVGEWTSTLILHYIMAVISYPRLD